ncbi:CTD nuclear envelope phosphatase 1-like protein [Iris pallida]|uniref:CTD nuclear envelope phosphatase 1-like protein n=1 Tax=Iris pallida TaxID=29817 RepID=A0AAX6GGR4_IRIPA|nr:CTD nuclear envelope phosphatase 1-like protein [Iris pallida]KAJ6827966.1 CTD nuclear envelope phosphatase 1-like protein [Iris pallida]
MITFLSLGSSSFSTSSTESTPATCPQAMAELAPAELFSPPTYKNRPAAARAWMAVVGWLGFAFQILIQVLRGTPSWNQLLSFVGIRHLPFLSSAAADGVAFKPLPAELPTDAPPPSAEAAVGRLKVVLDLDETLVCAYETSSLPNIVRTQAIEAGLKCFELECISIDKEVEGRQKVNHVTVFERPDLHEFLQKTSEFADLVLFTAGLEGYARPLVDRIDVENRFCLRLYRPATVSTEYREHVKDLSCISEDLSRIVIVDNNPFSFLLQPSNGIPCIPFSAGQPYDEQLLRVLLPLLKLLSFQKDVRPVLYERFRMPEWFQKHGIPPSDAVL